MIESSEWSSSRDEEIHKAAGNVQLRKYGQFFNGLASSRWMNVSSLEYLREGPVRLVYRVEEEADIISLVEMENKSLSKILAAVAGTVREIRMLLSESYKFYTKLFVHGEATFNGKSQTFARLFSDLQDLSIYVNRIFTVVRLSVQQLSSLSRSTGEVYLPALIEHLLDLFLVVVTLDEVVEAYPSIVEQWKTYRIHVRSVMHDPSKFSVPKAKLSTLEKLLKDLQSRILSKSLFFKSIEHATDISKTSNMNDHLVTYLKNATTDVENKLTTTATANKNWLRANVGMVVSTKLFGVSDKKLVRRLREVNKRLYAATLVGNVVWVPEKFLNDCLPRDVGGVTSTQIGEKLLAARGQKLPVTAGHLIRKATLWCAEAQELLRTSSDFRIKDIKKQCWLLKEIINLLSMITEQVSFVTNLHAYLSKPMSRGTVQIICRLVEVQKTLETTFAGLGPAAVQAQGRALQCLSYEILVILESAKKGLIQRDQSYSKEILDALSLISVGMRLMSGPPSSDRRLIVRCALAYARQLADTFRDEEAIKLREKLDDYDTIADLYGTISEMCDYSVVLHHRSMIPAYLTSMADDNRDISHIAHLLEAFNGAVDRQQCPEIEKVRSRELKEMLVKNVLEPACREIETSLRLHVHAHLKLDSRNPLKIGAKDGGRIVRASPLPIADKLISTKRFVEHYLDDMFYNLTTVALHDWKTYGTMHALANYKLSLDTVQNHLPTQTLEQGLDALEIMRNIHVFVSRYLYNLNTQTFVEHKSSNKHLNTIGIRHIANSIRTHGTGITSTTVNFVYQFLRIKLHTFSQFLFDEHIKSRLSRDIRFVKLQRENDATPYTYERAEKFQKGIRKLGMSGEGLSYLDHFRQLITQIGNALGYVRLIRSGGLHACANAISFLPGINSTTTPFESTCDTLNYSTTTRAAAKRLEDDVANLVRNFTEGIEYFKLLVDVFASAFRSTESHHLQQFYVIVPPLTLSFVDNALSDKEKILKRNKDGAAFTDDGFAMGIAYINALLDQSNELDGLQWFETVDRHINVEKFKSTESKVDAEDEKLQQTRALTLKRLNERNAEFQLLYYSLSGARVFFKQADS